MKKLYIWLLVGLLATAASISFKSNIWVLISMTSLLVTPVFLVTLRLVKRNSRIAEEKVNKLVAVDSSINDPDLARVLQRRERMKTEANELQAELKRINEISESYLRVERLAKWKIKCTTYHRMYEDILETVPDFNDDVKLEITLREEQ